MELKEILNKLYEGKKLTLRFTSSKEREAFRVSLYKSKSPQDKILQDILDEEKKVLRFTCNQNPIIDRDEISAWEYIAIIWLENKPSDSKDFEVLNIE